MDFRFSEDHLTIQSEIRNWAKEELAPLAPRMGGDFKQPPKQLLDQLAELGLTGMTIPEQYGGMGVDTITNSLVLEEVAAVCGSTAVTLSVHNSVGAAPLVQFGTEDQRKQWLPALSRGELWGAFALSEAGAGSDIRGMKSRAVLEDEEWVLNGSKMWITNGAFAGLFVLFARTENGPSAFLVTQGEGLTISKAEDKLGLRGSVTNEIVMEDLHIPKGNLLGTEGKGLNIALAALDGGRIGISSQALGLARAALERSIEWAQQREAFGKPIGKFQAISFRIAEMATWIEQARAMIYRAATLKDAGLRYTQEAAMAKYFSTERAQRICREAIQIMGGYGYSQEYPVERYFRDVRATTIYEGASQIQQLVIARNLLRD